jgi:ribosomal protein L23
MRGTSFTQKLSRSVASRRLRVAVAITGSAIAAGAAAAAPAVSQASATFVPQMPSLATIAGTQSNPAPWNEWQGDEGSAGQLSILGVVDPAQVLPTYEPAQGSTAVPNLSVFDGSNPTDSDTSTPYESGTVGTPGPLAGYCGSGDWDAESGESGTAPTPSSQPVGVTLPLGPYYFPHIVLNANGSLTGYFDYRPKDEDEAVVAATSTDGGKDWTFDDQALEQNAGYCASSDTNDDGQGHPNVLNFGGSTSTGDVTSGGTNDLFTLQRPAGDNAGVGMLVHSLSGASASQPLAGLPKSQPVGIDPDSFDADSSAVTVPAQGNGTVSLTVENTGRYGQVGALVPGGFVDLGRSGTAIAGNSGAADVIDCTGVTASTPASDAALGSPSSPAPGTPGQLTGCSVAGSSSITVDPQDMIEQVLGYTSTKTGDTAASTTEWSVPAGPNTETGDSAVGTNKGKFYISPAPSTSSVGFTYELSGITLNINAPSRVYVDGNTAYCAQSNNNPTTEVENCTAGAGGAAWTAAQGEPILTDPVVPTGSEMTSGLDGPDGIVGELHSFPTDGSFNVPSNATYVMYTEKLLDYYVAGETNGDSLDNVVNSAGDPTFGTAGSSAAFDISFDPWQYLPEDLASQITTSGSGAAETFGAGANGITITMGDQTTGDYLTIDCTAATTGSSSTPSGANGSALVAVGSTDWLTGCTITRATTSAGVAVPSGQLASFYGDDLAKNSMLGPPGAALGNPAQLQQQGEGKAASDPTNSSKLYSNNEDYAVIRVAWTTDGVNFYTAGLQNGGLISGSDSGSVASSIGTCAADASYTDLTNPDQQCNPTDASGNVDLNKYATPGTADATEMRWPGSAGTIIYNASTGEDELFLSGAWGGDGDSDAFNQVWYATSKDGLNWSVPTSVVSTDYSFSASAAQNQALAAGKDQPLGISAYYSGRAYGPSVVPNPDGGGLEMIFAGYRIPKGSGSVGDVLGTNADDQYTIGNGGNGDDPSAYRNVLVDNLAQSTAAAISFSAPSGSAVYGGSATLSATSQSSEPTTFAVAFTSSPSVCTVNGSTVHYVGVGSCVIDANQPAGDGYAVAGTQSVTIKVAPAPLRVIAPSLTITYGQAVPALHPTYSGLVNGDTSATVSAKCAAAYRRAGRSAITCSGVTDPDYTVTYTNGVLTVDRAATRTALKVAIKELRHGKSELVATVTVASGRKQVFGKVRLYDKGNVIATVALERGKATVSLAKLSSGVHKLDAAYLRSDDHTASSSRTVTVAVKRARTQRHHHQTKR